MTDSDHQLAFIEFGNKDGQLAVYFHGVPGSIQECSLFDSHAKDHNLRIICFDRFAVDHSVNHEHYYQQLATQIKNQAGVEPIDIIGFSIGAHIALEVGAILNDQVRYTHLVSPAAPLDAGDFIDSMAGAPVFKLAMQRPFIFSLLTHCQKFIAILAPQILVKMLFATAAGEDKQLSHQQEFKRYITPVIKRCFQDGINGYIRDINSYVTWSGHYADYSLTSKSGMAQKTIGHLCPCHLIYAKRFLIQQQLSRWRVYHIIPACRKQPHKYVSNCKIDSNRNRNITLCPELLLIDLYWRIARSIIDNNTPR